MTADYPGPITGLEETKRQLCDWVAAPFGADPRTTLSGIVNEPAFLWTNDRDPVYIYPSLATGSPPDPGDEDYEALTAWDSTGTSDLFKCRSLELFNDRMNYFNTEEGGERHRRRLRRSPIGNCDPDTVNYGAGFIDLEKFSGDGLRVERLGNMLACYLSDGMAVCRVTGSAIQPYAIETITLERGLLSTHSVCRIGSGRHFGIFNDGWFIVDNSGQFREVGLSNLGGGVTGYKWQYAFYDRMNRDLVDRIQLSYDSRLEIVYITAPIGGQEGERHNREVWIYDLLSDRVWPQVYNSTCFGAGQVVLEAATTYGGTEPSWAGDSYADLDKTYGEYAARFGLYTFMHGTQNATVMQHDPEIVKRDSEIPGDGSSFAVDPVVRYHSVVSPGGNPREVKEIREIWIETVRSTAGSVALGAYSADDDTVSAATINLTEGTSGKRIIQSAALHKSGTQLQVQVTSAGKIKIASLEADIVRRPGVRRLQGT